MQDYKPRKRRKDAGKKRVNSQYRVFSFKLDVERHVDVIDQIDKFVEQTDDRGKHRPLHDLIVAAMRGKPVEITPLLTQDDVVDLVEYFNDQIVRLDATINKLNELGVKPKPKGKEAQPAINQNYLANLGKALHGGSE